MRNPARTFSLVEVMVATLVLTVALLGVMSSYQVIHRSQRMTKEQQAATFAAQSMIDQIAAFHRLNGKDLTKTTHHGTDGQGFEVYLGSSTDGGGALGRGLDEDGNVTQGRTLQPGDPSNYPDSRNTAGPPHTQMAGFVTVKDAELPVGTPRDELLQVDVVVSWRSYGGDQRIAYSVILGPVR